jgi:site-specific DNA-methyltransferase (adenine-specific)
VTARWYTGDTRDVLRTLPDASVDLVLTSPPFLALRSYLPADHPDKWREIGSEANPGAFLDVLLDVVVELRRVLAPHGSLCVELGDTYAGGGQGPDPGKYAAKDDVVTVAATRGPGWPLPKSLCMVPSSFAWALAYGRNPWTGRELEPWRVRNLIAWCRPNPPVGALGDKFRPATSYMTVACTGARRYFDLEAVREPSSPNSHPRTAKGVASRPNDCKTSPDGNRATLAIQHSSTGAPPLDYWVIPPHPYPGSHYATWPPDLCVKPIQAMCPLRVCRVCGKPSERIVEAEPSPRRVRDDEQLGSPGGNGHHGHLTRVAETLGWTDCGCSTDGSHWRPGVVLDPFAGSGTTLSVATGHGRDAIGIDLDPRNFDLARERVGMFLEVAA